MRNIWTIARKELRAYFDHPTAYILLVVFLVINFFFYFRSAFLISEASLRPMFDLMPWILLFFVPAVAMGAVAEERRHGTLEVTLSHPIDEHAFLFGKYIGSLLFLYIGLAGTLLLPLALLAGGRPDLGVVVAQYVGTGLLVAGMAAVGLFASALTRNQITAFIVATAVIFMLMMAGTEVVQIGLPSWLGGPLGELGILPHFANVGRGVIDLRDVVYFVALAVAFLALAYWLLLRDRLSHGSRLYRNLRLGTLVIVAIAIFANLFGRHIPGRIDLTAERLYTVSRGTRQILGELDDVVTITLFTSRELPAQVRPLERDVSDVLRDFDRYGRGSIQVLNKYPERSEEVQRESQQLGIMPVQFSVMRAEELQVRQGWLGIAVQYADGAEVIPFVGETETLEYQLASSVWRLTRTERPKVAFVSGHGELTQRDYAAFSGELARNYEVASVDLTAEDAELGPDLDAIIIAAPKTALDARSRALFSNYMAADGRVLYLGEGADVNLRFLFASPVPDSAREVSEALGVRVNGDLVFDLRSNEAITVPGDVFSYIVPYPFWLRTLPAADHPVSRNLNSLFLPWASSLDTLQTLGGRSFTPLFATSDAAGLQRGAFEIRPDQEPFYNRADLEARLVAVAVEGAVGAVTVSVPPFEVPEAADTSEAEGAFAPASAAPREPVGAADTAATAAEDTAAAAAGAVQDTASAFRAAGTNGGGQEQATEQATTDTGARVIATQVQEGPPTGRAVVVGDADFLTDRFARNAEENLIFALNAVDWLTQSDALLSIRSKQRTPRPLVFESDMTKQTVKYVNLIGVPLLLVIFGTVRLMRRRGTTRRTYGE
ncbi:MAG: Gldg family protein [Gemmatimonadota bacterium]|nr:MAG: Gldg family protein [Gemmatimonadota bacterium]